MPDAYTTTYLGRTGCAPGVETFRFSRPPGYGFTPGQFFQLTLTTRDGEQSKYFSHADAPDDPAIELTTRLSGSAFKDALLALEPGTATSLRGPMGRLAVPAGAGSVAFLTGGVGITPAHSIIRHEQLGRTGLRLVLFYANRDPSCVPYGAEFRAYAQEDPAFTYVEVFEHPDEGWTGPVGYLTADIVRDHIDPAAVDHWIVSGPPPMVEAMRRVVADLNIPPERASFEQFAGY